MTQKNSEASSLLSFSLPSDPSTSITVSLLGGTLISWKVKGQEQLYVSPISEPCFEKAAILMTNDTLSDASSPKTKSNNYPRKPIRGGVPLVFPVFGKSDAFPWQHGFARNLLWRHEWTLASFGKSQDSHEDDGHASEAEDDSGSSCSEVQSTVSDDDFYGAQASQTTFVFPKENYTGENITLQLALNTNDLAKAAASLRHTFPFEFELYVILKLYKASLKMTFQVHNLAESTQPLPFSALFHSYFAVSDIANISIAGLSGCPFSDKLTNESDCTEKREKLAIEGEIDRVYVAKDSSQVFLRDPGSRDLLLERINFPDLVIWNPWSDKGAAMNDFPDADYKKMVCIEAGRLFSKETLAPGASWAGAQFITVLSSGCSI